MVAEYPDIASLPVPKLCSSCQYSQDADGHRKPRRIRSETVKTSHFLESYYGGPAQCGSVFLCVHRTPRHAPARNIPCVSLYTLTIHMHRPSTLNILIQTTSELCLCSERCGVRICSGGGAGGEKRTDASDGGSYTKEEFIEVRFHHV